MIKTLIKESKGYRIPTLLSPILIVLEVFLEVQIPQIMAELIDSPKAMLEAGAANNEILSFVILEGGKMIGMAIVSLICGALAAKFAAQAGMGFGANLRASIFKKIQSFSFSNTDKFSTPSLITRMTTDINTVQMGYMMIIRMFVRSPIMFVMAFGAALNKSKDLSMVFVIAAPFMLILLATVVLFAFPRFKKLMKKYDGINASIQETLIGSRVIKAFVRACHEKDKFRISNDELRDASISAEKLLILTNPVMMLTVYGCTTGILFLGSKLVLDGMLNIGDMTEFLAYISNILMSLMMISAIFTMTIMSRASVTRLLEVLREEPDINDDSADPSLTVANGDIDMENVCFKYKKNGKKNVINNINLHIKSGETVGIIGGTGSAKTTLVQMIPRLYDVTEGVVKVGGRPVADYTLKNLRDAVAMVLQVNLLFSGTIEENLRWGNENATAEEIENACRIAQAHDFVTSFPDGYQTNLGQGGVNLSGGQKQRLCIARALLKSPKVLILDDSTSAVDTATDAKIREGFKENHGDVTTVIVAQRISSIQHADKIIVLDDGRIDAIGTHDELLASNEIYSEVYNSQQKGGEE